MVGGNQTPEQANPIVDTGLNSNGLDFDNLKFEKGKDQDDLVKFVKGNIDKLRKKKLINKCKEYFNDTKKIDAIINNKEAKDNLNNYYNSDPADSSIWAVGFLLTALDGKDLQNQLTPTGQDVYNYFKKLKQEVEKSQNQEVQFKPLEETGNGEKSTQELEKKGIKIQDTGENENIPRDKEQNESVEIQSETLNKRRHVLTHLGMKPLGGAEYKKDTDSTDQKTNFETWKDNQPDVYQRNGYSGIYKFTDDGADLIYISDADEKNWKATEDGKNQTRIPNQIYTFDENYREENVDGKISGYKDIVDQSQAKKGEKWIFINNTPQNNGNVDNRGSDFSWLATMNSGDMYSSKTGNDGEKTWTQNLGKDWKSIQENWEKEQEEEQKSSEQEKKEKEEAQKNIEAKNEEETKQLKNILSEYGLLDDIQEIAKMQNAISEVDEIGKINELQGENEKIKKEYNTLQKELLTKQEVLQKAKGNSMIEESLNEAIADLQNQISEKVKKYNENKQEISRLKTINKQENLELGDRIDTKSNFKKGEYGNGREWRQYKKKELLSEKQESLVNKLEDKIKEITEASEITEIIEQDREKFTKQLPLLTQVLESQKVLLNLGKDDSDYLMNDADQIVKKGDNINYTMDTYGRLVKNEVKGENSTVEFVQFDNGEKNKNDH